MIKKSTKLYYILWEDSSSPDCRWGFISDMEKPRSCLCASVGWVTHETKKVIRIIPHISSVTNKHHQGSGQGLMVIPKSAIRKKKKLKL